MSTPCSLNSDIVHLIIPLDYITITYILWGELLFHKMLIGGPPDVIPFTLFDSYILNQSEAPVVYVAARSTQRANTWHT